MGGTGTIGATVFVTGSTGRLGRLLRLVWPDLLCGMPVVWSARQSMPGGLTWDIGRGAGPAMARHSIVVHLAGVLRDGPDQLAHNAVMAEAVCRVAHVAGARHVFLASTAAVYRPMPDDIPESAVPAPANPYGAAKLAAEQAARRVMRVLDAPGLTALRIGNVAGADALLGRQGTITLDPVPGQAGGPARSCIGPRRFAEVLADLIQKVMDGADLPPVLNVAEPGVVSMADLLTAAGRDWQFGPLRAQTIARVGLDTSQLCRLIPMAPATATGIVTDLAAVSGRWP